MSAEVALGYTVAAATAVLHSLLEAAAVARHAHSPQAEEAIVGVFDRGADCILGGNGSGCVHSAADTIVGQRERPGMLFDQEVYSSVGQVLGEASAAVDS